MVTNFANQYYGLGNWFIDCFQRTIPDHFHWHIRRIDFDSHIPLFRVFGSDTKTDKRVALCSLDNVKEISQSLVLQHGLSKNPKNKHFIILDKHVQSLSEQQRAKLDF